MSLNPREKAVAVELFCSAAVQQQVAFGQFKVGGREEGCFASLCSRAAKTFCEVAEDLDLPAQVTGVALKVFANTPNAMARIAERDRREVVLSSFAKAQEFLADFDEPEAKVESSESDVVPAGEASGDQQAAPLVTDVSTEDLDLPQKTKDLLLSLSTAEIDLTSARKIRAADDKQSIEKLEHIGVQIRKKILEAVEKAIGPVVAE